MNACKYVLCKKECLNTLFHIEGAEEDKGDILLCEWGAAHCCIAWYHEQAKSISHLHYISFDNLGDSMIQHIIEALSERSADASKIVLCSSFAQSVLIPARLYESGHHLVQELFGAEFSRELTDPINEWQLVNAYAFPEAIAGQLSKKFPDARYMHVHTPELKIYNGFVSESQVSIHFSPRHFRVIVKREGKLQLAQIYNYTAPLDVVYYLLKIFEEFDLHKDDTPLILSGLIDEASSLFTEVESYFVDVHFAQPAGVNVGGQDHPPHFFSSMYNLAICAS